VKRRSTDSSSRGRRAGSAVDRDAPVPRFEVRGRVPSDPESIARVLELAGVEPSRGLGQNFLIDPTVAEQEAALVDLPAGSRVVEVGGGLGQLTLALLSRGFQVTVLEKDPRLGAYLAVNFEGKAQVLFQDALEGPLPPAEAFVGNLPFSSGGEILRRLVDSGMEHGVFLLQREVAQRLVASAGTRAYGRPTVLFRLDGVFRLAGDVPPTAFHPEPKVHGAFVVWRRDPLDPAPTDRRSVSILLEAAFAQRRKMLGGTLPSALAHRLHISAAEVERLVDRADWGADWRRKRAEEIPPESYVALANLLSEPKLPS
jgi:16S rRNA (adenine1518-N6/adenine1519-N6)-dimethyltransferase